jgi:hypothetical protein
MGARDAWYATRLIEEMKRAGAAYHTIGERPKFFRELSCYFVERFYQTDE